MPGSAGTVVLFGFTGSGSWESFSLAPEAGDGQANPLDRWSRRVIDDLAAQLGATALYPFGGPPHHPFQRWAQRAERVFPSPLGILIHPTFGLWHSYRGALAFREALELPVQLASASPCESCAEKPCLSPCPVSAFSNAGYDVAGCRSHISNDAGSECMSGGCLARRACPIGAAHRYVPAQAAFHMRAFRRG